MGVVSSELENFGKILGDIEKYRERVRNFLDEKFAYESLTGEDSTSRNGILFPTEVSIGIVDSAMIGARIDSLLSDICIQDSVNRELGRDKPSRLEHYYELTKFLEYKLYLAQKPLRNLQLAA
jgi:hypothetical protein